MRMSIDLRDLFLYEAFLYYNPLLLVVSSESILFWFFFFRACFSSDYYFLVCGLLNTLDDDGLAVGSELMGVLSRKC